MGILKDDINDLIDAQYARGLDGAKIAKRLIEAGLKMMIDEGDFATGQKLLPTGPDGRFTITTDTPDNGYSESEIERMTDGIAEAARMFDGYAQLHLAKSPPDVDKAGRNIRMATKLCAIINEPYNPPAPPTDAPESPAQGNFPDLLPETAERPRKLSTDPLDRAEVLAWFDMKLDGCTKAGMSDTYTVLRAFRDEIAQHLEAAPIDIPAALRAFYDDVHARNVKAGWWSDLATSKPKKRSVGELFMLFVTELWEAYDAYCAGMADDKLPHLPGLAVELGDLQIRLADFCGALQAGKIVSYSGVRNAGDEMFREIGTIAEQYERIRKTPAANGDPEMGDELQPQDVPGAIFEKLEFNANRADHKPENRMKEGGKQT